MKILSSEIQAKEVLKNYTDIVLVPTMGNLHDGHISLVNKAKEIGKTIVSSIFINPLQFGVNEDFDSYPRTLENDLIQLEGAGSHFVFHPSKEILEGIKKRKAPLLSKKMCGKTRPDHFDGVVTIVGKLFEVIKPQFAVFGLKDYQQFLIIKDLASLSDFETEIIGSAIVREKDGLAMSSRNNLLTPDDRLLAPEIYKRLCWIKENISKKPNEILIKESIDFFKTKGLVPEYLKICDAENLEDLNHFSGRALIAIAMKLGDVRLIDNILLD
tara:strand:- start:1675 stop:2487 length:813 start_codon:yes stop_codon:yes gene_type:complete